LHGVFERTEATLHNSRPRASRRHHDFDSDAGLATGFAADAEQNRMAQAVLLAEPQPVVEAPRRTALADIDIGIVQRCDRHRAPIVAEQARKRQRFVVFLGKPEQVDMRSQQPVQRGLDVHSHVEGKLPGGRHELAERNVLEVRIQDFECIGGLTVPRIFGIPLFHLLLPLHHDAPYNWNEYGTDKEHGGGITSSVLTRNMAGAICFACEINPSTRGIIG